MSVCDLYAVSAPSLEDGNALLSSILGLEFVGRNSDWFGDYDLAALPDGKGEIKLQPNRNPEFQSDTDPPEERYLEHQFADHSLLLYVSVEELARAERLQALLLAHSPTVRLLSREQLEP